MDLLSLALQVAFLALFGVALWRYARNPGRLELAVVAVFATTAVSFSITVISQLVPDLADPLRPLSSTVLLAQPLLIVWLVSMMANVPRWAHVATFVGFALSSALLVGVPERPGWVVLVAVGYFVTVETAAAIGLVRESQRRYGLPRLRVALAGAATALFGIAILIAGASVAASGGQASEQATVLSRLAALAAGVGYLAAFVPPLWLRRLAQRAVAFDVTHALVAAPTGTEAGVLWKQLALAARQILGARRVDVVGVDGAPLTAPISGERVSSREAGNDAMVDDARIEVPIKSEGRRMGTLVARLDGRPLFVEDDVALVELLARTTGRTVEREAAVAGLSQAQAALEASAAVRASEARFRALLEAHPNAILAIDDEGVITWSTGTAAGLFGCAREELVGMRLAQLVQLTGEGVDRTPPDSPNAWRAETVATRADGSTFPAETAISKFEVEGRNFELAVIADISWRHAADQVRDRFMGILSHELRTPITSIFGGTQLLKSRGERLGPEDRAELLDDVAAEAERLQRIVENLLVLARVERGAEFAGPGPVLLNRALEDLLSRERAMWPQLTIRLSAPPDVPIVAADDQYVAQTMRNLLSNAAKYAGEGSTVEVVVEPDSVDEEVRVLVRDDGPGVAAEDIDQLFKLYFRSRDAAATPGAGIGLFVCRQLVAAMGGRIWVSRRPEGGAEFGFSLPLYAEDDGAAPSVARPSARAAGAG